MKITIERDAYTDESGSHPAETLVFQDVLDYVVSVHVPEPMADEDGKQGFALKTKTVSHFTTSIRPMVMELQQTCNELQDHLKRITNAST